MLEYGDLRSWDPQGLTAASDQLRADLRTLEKARDELEAKAVPDSWSGLARIFAVARKGVLLATMDGHIEGAGEFERAVFRAQARVQAISTLVDDIDHDARGQDFEIRHDGSAQDVAPSRALDSVRAAEAYTERRIALRDALADRVRSVLDEAYDVDSALVHARPDGPFIADGEQGYVIDPEVGRAWEDMSDDERKAVLENMSEELAEQRGLEDFEVRIEDLEDQDGDGKDDDPSTDSRGSWSEDDRVLRLDAGNLDDPTLIGTMAHEVRHAVQHQSVDDLPSGFEQWLIDRGVVDDDFEPPPGATRKRRRGLARQLRRLQVLRRRRLRRLLQPAGRGGRPRGR